MLVLRLSIFPKAFSGEATSECVLYFLGLRRIEPVSKTACTALRM
jgi:hypothetical protein